jgi:hypothetical protein
MNQDALSEQFSFDTGLPGWTVVPKTHASHVALDERVCRDGEPALRIDSTAPKETRVTRTIVVPRGEYSVRVWMRTRRSRVTGAGGRDATLGVRLISDDRPVARGRWKTLPVEDRVELAPTRRTGSWTLCEATYLADRCHEVHCVLYASGRGTAWFAALEMERVPGVLEPPPIPPLCMHPAPPHGTATGFVHLERLDGVWWLVDPDGTVFWDLGMCAVRYEPDAPELVRSFPNRTAWAKKMADDLARWGVTSLGAWYGPEVQAPATQAGLRYHVFIQTVFDDWAHSLHAPDGSLVPGERKFPDPFDPAWRARVKQQVRRLATPRRDDPRLIAYHVDNELAHWSSVIPCFYSDACVKEFCRWLAERYQGRIADLNRAWSRGFHFTSFDDIARVKPDPRTPEVAGMRACRRNGRDPMHQDFVDFERRVIREYCEFTYHAVKEVDPNHLVLSHRFSCFSAGPLGRWSWGPMEEFGRYDAIALNLYPQHGPYLTEDELDAVHGLHERTGRPLVVTEWNLSSYDSGHRKWGWAFVVRTQLERGAGYRNIISQLVRMPFVCGAHWFRLFDRFDIEDYNAGLSRTSGEPYEPLLAALVETNQTIRRVPER